MELTEGSRVVFIIQNIKIKKVVPRTPSWVLKNNIVFSAVGSLGLLSGTSFCYVCALEVARTFKFL